MPKYDKQNQLIRDADGEIEFEERFFPPNVNALAHVLDRIDPQPNLEPEQPGIAAPAEMDPERVRAETLFYYGLAKQSVGILVDLGVDRKSIEMAAIIDRFEAQITVETSSTKVESASATVDVTPAAEPAKVATVASGDRATPTEQMSSETTFVAEPEPRRPKFEDAF